MSIDLYAPRRCIDIPFLCEHVYLRLAEPSRPVHEQLQIREVYDVLVRNPPGSEPLTGLYALFPHDCTTRKDGQYVPAVEAPEVNENLARVMPQYEWPFLRAPEKLRNGWVTRVYPANPRLGTDALAEAAAGTALPINVGFPPELRECEGGIEALANRRKTLVHLQFLGNIQLKGGEQGWLRLIVTPRNLDVPRPRVKRMSGLPDECSQWFTVYCPIVIRDQVWWLLDSEVPSAPKTGESKRTRTAVKGILFGKGGSLPGTSTRIDDHRIAIVAPPEIDVDSPISTPSAHFYGVHQIDLGDNTALMWATGSSKNWESDLVYNATRVLDRLKFLGPDREKELVRDLAPSGRYAALAHLLAKMKEVGLVREVGGSADRLVTVAADEAAGASGLLALRRLYASREAYAGGDAPLMQQFSDSHPFSIHHRVGVRALSGAIVDEAPRPNIVAKTLHDSVVGNGAAGSQPTLRAPSKAPEEVQSAPASAPAGVELSRAIREGAFAHSGGNILQIVQYIQEQVMGLKYVDQSTGPTGARAIGPHGRAESHGDVTQILSAPHAKELSGAFEQLIQHVETVEVGDPAPKRETAVALDRARIEASAREPRKYVIASAWETAKSWLEGALALGVFVADKAEAVRGLIEKITNVLR